MLDAKIKNRRLIGNCLICKNFFIDVVTYNTKICWLLLTGHKAITCFEIVNLVSSPLTLSRV